MSWTSDRIEQLMALAAQGLSARQIANELGGVSRNAVIGAMHRRGVAFVGTRERQAKRERIKPPPAPAGRIVQSLPKKLKPVPIPTVEPRRERFNGHPVKLFDLKDWMCRFPIDGPDDTAEQRRFCGCERMDERTPYCERHHAVCYVGLPQRKRRRENGTAPRE